MWTTVYVPCILPCLVFGSRASLQLLHQCQQLLVSLGHLLRLLPRQDQLLPLLAYITLQPQQSGMGWDGMGRWLVLWFAGLSTNHIVFRTYYTGCF